MTKYPICVGNLKKDESPLLRRSGVFNNSIFQHQDIKNVVEKMFWLFL